MYDQTLLVEVEVVDVPAAVAEDLASAEALANKLRFMPSKAIGMMPYEKPPLTLKHPMIKIQW